MRRSVPTLFLLAASPAYASGLDVPQVGTIFSGVTTADAAAVFHNPAMLTGLRTPRLMLNLGLVVGDVRYTRERLGDYQFADGLQFEDPVDPAYLDPSKTGTSEPVSATPLAPWAGLYAGGAVHRDVLFLGGGVSVPYAAPLQFDPEGAQRFSLTQAFIAVAQTTFSVAVKPHRTIRLGAGVSYLLGTASLARRQDFAGVDLLGDALSNPPIGQPNDFGADAPSTMRELEVFERPFAYRDGLAHGVSFQASLAIMPIEALTLAASYEHGGTLLFDGTFQLDLDDPFFQDDLSAKGLSYPRLVEGTGQLAVTLPHRIKAGVGVDISPKVHLDGLFEYVVWSSVDSFGITLTSPDLAQPALGMPDTTSVDLPRRWVDSVHANLRTDFAVTDTVRMAAMVGYQSPASPDATVDVASPDGHRLMGGLGASIQLRPKLSLLVDSQVQGILPRHVTTSDFDLANGTYELVIASVGLHLNIDITPKKKTERGTTTARPVREGGP